MKKLLALLILTGFLTAGIGCGGTTTKEAGGGGAAPGTNETFREVADRMVEAINAADYEGLRKDFNRGMLEAFPVEKCRTFFNKEILGKFGKINKLEPPQFKSATKAVFVARCERGALDFTLTLDDQGRVAGMLFRPH